MTKHNDNHINCINDLTLINYDNLGTSRQGMIISAIIKNWDKKKYLKPNDKLLQIDLRRSKLHQFTSDNQSPNF